MLIFLMNKLSCTDAFLVHAASKGIKPTSNPKPSNDKIYAISVPTVFVTVMVHRQLHKMWNHLEDGLWFCLWKMLP